MPVELGSPIEGAPRPSFHASLNGEAAIIELDSGAVFRQAEHATAAQLPAILDSKRHQIREAAIRLAEDGFVTRRDEGIEILITALDL